MKTCSTFCDHKMQIKIPMRYPYYTHSVGKIFKSLTVLKVGKSMYPQDFLHFAGRNINWCHQFGRQL